MDYGLCFGFALRWLWHWEFELLGSGFETSCLGCKAHALVVCVWGGGLRRVLKTWLCYHVQGLAFRVLGFRV